MDHIFRVASKDANLPFRLVHICLYIRYIQGGLITTKMLINERHYRILCEKLSEGKIFILDVRSFHSLCYSENYFLRLSL